MANQEEYAEHYAVFTTVKIPTQSLNDFFTAVRTHYPPFIGTNVPSEQGTVLSLITTKSDASSTLEKPQGGTRAPVLAFQTPFLGHTIQQLRTEFRKVTTGPGNWAWACFAVLDEQFVRDGTVLLVSMPEESEDGDGDGNGDGEDEDEDGDVTVLNHRCDKEITLELLVQFENSRVGVDWHPDDSEVWGWVLSREYLRERNRAVGY